MATRKEMDDSASGLTAAKKKAAEAKKMESAQKGQVRMEFNQAQSGLNMDSTINQVKTGNLTYALNATVENFDSSSINYQNEPGNEPCLSFPDGYELIGKHTIPEKKKNIFFLVNPLTGGSEIGFMFNNDCQYRTLINAPCLNFSVDHPIPKVVHKITNCTTEIYWTDGFNARRYLNVETDENLEPIGLPYTLISGSPNCDPVYSDILDCNQLKIQPNFDIPFLDVNEVTNVGSLEAGMYQFAIQYSDATGNDLTSYYSVTNPCPIADPLITTVNFNYPVGKSIIVKVSNLDISGQFNYFNLAVIKTINNITSVELVGVYNITETTEDITYTGADQTAIRLSINDIFEKYPYYDIAKDLTSVQDVLVWDNLTSIDRINYQQIANDITLQWETHRLPADENYADEENATNLRGYMRDEVYAFEIVFLLKNGKQTDSFHIPGPNNLNVQPDIPNTNDDFIGEPDYFQNGIGYSPYWKIYNNAINLGFSPGYLSTESYKGPYEFGEFAYWESTEKYPCNKDVWGNLADQPIRHHKFPDVLISPIIESPVITYDGNNMVPVMQDSNPVFPMGVKINDNQISNLILTSDLTQDQKDDIVGFKIVRGDRGTNRSIIAKGILRNVNSYIRQDQEYYYPNYPYNQISGEDSFLQENNNAWNYKSKAWLVYMPDSASTALPGVDLNIVVNSEDGVFSYTSVTNGRPTEAVIKPNCIIEVCSITRPVALKGVMTIGPGDYDIWKCFHDSGAYCGWRSVTQNPFNNINFDGTLVGKKWWAAYFLPFLTDKTGTVITDFDPDFDYDGQFNEDAGGHAFRPGIETKQCVSINGSNGRRPMLKLAPLGNNGVCVNEDGTNAANGNYSPGCFSNQCTEGPNGEACQCCIDTVNGEPSGFGEPTNPLPAVVPNPDDSTNTFTPQTALEDGGSASLSGTGSRQGRRSCLNCDKDTPITPLDGPDAERAKDILDKLIFNSPDTSFGQPFLGGVLKLESVMAGAGKAHFVEVKDNAKYKLLTKEAQQDALDSSERVANMGSEWNAGVMFTVYQSYLTIYINGITRKNYAMSFNSRANYDYSFPIDNNVSSGIKQREIELARYLIPGVQSFNNNDAPINNWNRESSVYIKTKTNDNLLALPIPQDTNSLAASDGTSSMVEYSRFAIGDSGACSTPEREQDIKVVSYYASMKNIIPNQWGQINSFKRIDTGYQKLLNSSDSDTIFGGDVFISRFTFKTKLPFFIDNRVEAPDDSDIFFDELGNVAYPKYWHSARSILSNYTVTKGEDAPQNMFNLISTKANNFDCPSDPSLYDANTDNPIAGTYRTFYNGYMYLWAYGVPNFYCESVYNTDLRQAFNTKEGDFWPHVSSGIPDEWFQEVNVPIAQDNTYYYNVTYSKQNKENSFSQLPPDWREELCFTFFPFRAIYSDSQSDTPDNRVNNWLVYRALNLFDFPQNYGDLISLDGIQDKAVLARFENKALLYNKLLTIDTSNPQAAYIGNPKMFSSSPPIDFAETDLGYVGSQHKFLLKLPYGQITADAKRGQLFLISGNKAVDITGFGSGVNRFMTNSLPFEILEYFPEVNIDNNFTGFGLHGVYDSKFDRIIITKLDYIPINSLIYFDIVTQNFYLPSLLNNGIDQQIFLSDTKYFCNKSWTMSFDFSTKSWISFHSYLPNFYIGENNFYYSGINGCCTNFTAILDTPDRSRIDKEEPNLEMMVGVLDAVVLITTSTTTTTSPLFTTTTTIYTPDCNFNISLTEELSCDIDGVGYITVPTPTTTTLCVRPTPLTTSTFVEGYQIKGTTSPVVGTATAQEACSVAAFSFNDTSTEIVPITFNYQYRVLDNSTSILNSQVYLGISQDCTIVPDGWYSVQYETGTVFYVENGFVKIEQPCNCNTLTTTTTVYAGAFDQCCTWLMNDDNGTVNIYKENIPDMNGIPVTIPNYTSGKLAIGPSTLYGVSPGFNTTFKKWKITTNPWTVEVASDLTIADNSFGTTAGIVVKDDNTLIAIDTSQGYIVEIDASTGIPSQKILVGGNYTYSTNLLYTKTGKLITIGKNTASGNFHYFQWDYDNEVANPEINTEIINSEFVSCRAIMSCDCEITIVAEGSTCENYLFQVETASPFRVVGIGCLDYVANPPTLDDVTPIWSKLNITNVTQQASCVTKGTDQFGTTTTTTTAPATTTTTTSIYPCYGYEVVGPQVVWYPNCVGDDQSISVPTGETLQFCSSDNTITGTGITLLGACPL